MRLSEILEAAKVPWKAFRLFNVTVSFAFIAKTAAQPFANPNSCATLCLRIPLPDRAMPPCSCNCRRQVWRSYIETGRSIAVEVDGVEFAFYDHECLRKLRTDCPEMADQLAAALGLPEDEDETIAMDAGDDHCMEILLKHCLSVIQTRKRRRAAQHGRPRLGDQPAEPSQSGEEAAEVDANPQFGLQGEEEEEEPRRRKRARLERPEILQRLKDEGPDSLTSPARLREFAKIYLFMAAEVLERTGAADNVKQPFFDALDPETQETLTAKRRCTFNTVTDITTLAVMKEIWRFRDDGPQLLYHIVSAAVVLNSRVRYQAFAEHLDVHNPLSAESFRDLYLEKFSKEEAPPMALRQCALVTLTTSRKGANEDWGNKSFQGSARFMETLGARCKETWDELNKILEDPPAPPYVKEAPAVTVLRQKLHLGPFMAQHVARLLAVIHPKLYNLERLDCGAGAVHGLLLLHGVSKEQARVWKGKLKQEEYTALFENLLRHLPGKLRKLGGADVLRMAEDSFMWPYAARTVQHMLCEARKVWSPEGRPDRHGQTSDVEYLQLWIDSLTSYAHGAFYMQELEQPQQTLFKEQLRSRPPQTSRLEPISSSQGTH